MTEWVEKRLSSRQRDLPEAILRLRSEAELLTRLSPSGVTPRLLESGEGWLRTERIPFPTLAERPALPGGALCAAFTALAILHEAGDDLGSLHVVHADLSPANVIITEDRAWILDFDLAWWRDGPDRNDGAFRGTIHYVAPEVARAERPTTQSDIFSLAATLLYAITGVLPRDGASFAALLSIAAENPVVVDPMAHPVLARCLCHDPHDRPRTARDVLALIG